MKAKLKIFLTLLFFLPLYSCNNPTENTLNNSISGSYAYTGFDKTGKVIIKGYFNLNFKDKEYIYGEWHFYKVDDPKGIGPQYGDGEFQGRYSEGKLWIGLNPNFADHNVELIGFINSDTFTGKWNYFTYVGITNYGTFKAVKIE